MLIDAYKEAGVIDTVKVVPIPKGRNHVQVRLENLGDLYDSNSKTANISISRIAYALWGNANIIPQTENQPVIKIEELSLTGNMAIKEMWSRKIKWATVDDDSTEFPQSAVDYDFDGYNVTLEPQRIRVFSLKYSVESVDGQDLFLY